VYQTIGGAVATGTHGSSVEWGSLSSPSQLLGLEVVTADGAVRRFTPANSPFLFKVGQGAETQSAHPLAMHH
jgi:FAD/FMN-containing dehydrogenase